MTIAKTTAKKQYAGDGGSTAFSFPYRFFNDTDLEVYILSAAGVETLKTLTTHYTVANNGNETGGTVTMLSAPAVGETITILRSVPLTQSTDYQANDAFPAETHEAALDRLTLIAQQNEELNSRALRAPVSDTASLELPFDRANSVLGFDASKNPIAAAGAVPATAYMATLLDDPDAKTARETLGSFDTVADLLADTTLTTSNTSAGDIVEAGGLRFERAADGAVGVHLSSAGGLGFYNLDYAKSAAAQTQLVMEKLENDDADIDIAVLGDSTGDSTTEWVYLLAQDIGADYPAFTIKYRLWNDGTSSYAAAVTIQSGTGANTLTIYNASIAGAIANKFAGERFGPAIAQIDPALVMVSYGHNGGSSAITQQGYFNALAATLRAKAFNTPVVIIGQNPTTVDDSMAAKVDMLRALSEHYGFGFIDVHGAFRQSPTALALLLADTVHPNASGSSLWAKTVGSAFHYDGGAASGGRLDGRIERAEFHYADFDSWTANGTAAVVTDLTSFETFGHSAKLTSSAGAGWIYKDLVGTQDITAFRGKRVTLAVRVKIAGGESSTAGRIELNDGVASETTSDGGPQGTEYYWQIVSMDIAASATRVRAYIYAASDATTNTVNIDRVILSSGPYPLDALPPADLETIRGLKIFGDDAGGTVVIRNNTTGNTGIQFLSTTSGSDDDDPATEYTAALGSDKFGFKARGDAYNRVEIVPSSGGVWFGPGTSLADMSLRANGVDLLEARRAHIYSSDSDAYDLGLSNKNWRRGYFKEVRLGASNVIVSYGTGSPEGVVTAPVGSTFHRTDGGAGTSYYVKESGTGNTGWAAK